MDTPLKATIINRKNRSIYTFANIYSIGTQGVVYWDGDDRVDAFDGYIPQEEYIILAEGHTSTPPSTSPTFDITSHSIYNADFWKLPQAVVCNRRTQEETKIPYFQHVYCWKLNAYAGRPLGYKIDYYDDDGLYCTLIADANNFDFIITPILRYIPMK